MAAPAYRDTKVGVDKSRGDIAKLLARVWLARGLSWEDDLDTGASTLRFRWKLPDGDEAIVVRLRLTPDPARVKIRNADERERLRQRESKRLHRVAFWWLKAMAEAVEAGLLTREAVVLPWVEATATGETVSDLLVPRLGLVSRGRLALPTGGK